MWELSPLGGSVDAERRPSRFGSERLAGVSSDGDSQEKVRVGSPSSTSPQHSPAAALLGWVALLLGLLVQTVPAFAGGPPTLAFLGTFFQNENEGLEPTTGPSARVSPS